MKSKKEFLKNYSSKAIDSRDTARLLMFLKTDEFGLVGAQLNDTASPEQIKEHNDSVKEWTEENIISQMSDDVTFGFQKALSQRGISSSMMYLVVLMWLNILEDEELLALEENYAHYGLPLFKAVAVKYKFDNPIGDDTGAEAKYSV